MTLVPLTVYLPRAQLVQLERRAALAGLSRSGFAARAIEAALTAPSLTPETIAQELSSLRAETERLSRCLAGEGGDGHDAGDLR
jgi:hypothetical protein